MNGCFAPAAVLRKPPGSQFLHFGRDTILCLSWPALRLYEFKAGQNFDPHFRKAVEYSEEASHGSVLPYTRRPAN